ncbi:hypothetical protein [Bosea sp. PAMC 26642]|nr:hypothetical protein [Bosea sp. PAMC 26642]
MVFRFRFAARIAMRNLATASLARESDRMATLGAPGFGFLT